MCSEMVGHLTVPPACQLRMNRGLYRKVPRRPVSRWHVERLPVQRATLRRMNDMEREIVLEQIHREIAPAIAAYTVVLGRIPTGAEEARVDWLKGTGILTKVESTSSYGILTAGHVVGALRKEHEREDPKEISLLVRPARAGDAHAGLRPLQVQIPQGSITAHGIRNREREGPDIAWIPLAVDVAHSIESHRSSGAVFYNFEKGEIETTIAAEALMRGKEAEPRIGTDFVVYAAGWNAEKQLESGGEEMTIWECEAIQRTLDSRDGWHYSDYVVQGDGWNHVIRDLERNPEGETVFEHPAHWGGISGGGVWHITRSQGVNNSGLRKYLAGIIFYELPLEGERVLRAHVLVSIRRILNEAGIDGNNRISEDQFRKMVEDIDAEAEADAEIRTRGADSRATRPAIPRRVGASPDCESRGANEE